MNAKRKYSIIIGVLICCISIAQSTEIPDGLILGFKEGKSESVSKYFTNTIELIIDNKENIYSKTQAQIILKDFFKKNNTQNFSILHKGGKSESRYVIGNLETAQGNYRITILLKLNNNKTHIHQLRIEKDDV